MTTERQIKRRYRRGHGRNNADRDAFLAGFEMGRKSREALPQESGDAKQAITRRPRHGHQPHHNPESEFGHCGGRAGRHARSAWERGSGEHRHDSKQGRGQLPQLIEEMQAQIEMLERKMRHMQRKARLHAVGSEEQVEIRNIVRTRRENRAGYLPSRTHRNHRFHGEGRRMGRTAHRIWKDRQPEA